MTESLLSIDDLSIGFHTEKGFHNAIEGVSLSVKKGKTLAIVGESGCGKSVTSLAVMKLLPENGEISNGKITFKDQDLTNLDQTDMRSIRGNEIAMIFQEPMTALNPVFTVGQQISEVFRVHKNMSKKEAREASLKMLEKVQIPDPQQRIDEYPFQMSGGMRQRVLIAIALACSPKLLIADEPTTALDVTIQAQIITLMKDLQKELETAIVFITHDLGVVAQLADDVAVMYAGKLIEKGTVFDIFDDPQHPYTQGLLDSLPKINDSKATKLNSIPGNVPSIADFTQGCRFAPRCTLASSTCHKGFPSLEAINPSHQVACYNRKGRGIQ